MKKTKKIAPRNVTPLVTFLIFTLFLAGLVTYYQALKQEKQELYNSTTTPTSSPLTILKNYSNEEFSFSFTYPDPQFKVSELASVPKASTITVESTSGHTREQAEMSISVNKNPVNRYGQPITSVEESFGLPFQKVEFMNKDARELIYTDAETEKALRKDIRWLENNELWSIELKATDKTSEAAQQLQAIFDSFEFQDE